MTVGAILSLDPVKYAYSTNTEYKYFGSTVSEERLNDLMSKYGVQQTGDSETDLRALYTALYRESALELEGAQSSSNNANSQRVEQSQPTQAQNSSNVPWATLMGQVGLITTGDFETDLNAFSEKIGLMQSSATSAQDKAIINQLVAQAEVVFVQPEQSTAQAASSQIQNAPQPQQISGADIQAQLNKLFLVTG